MGSEFADFTEGDSIVVYNSMQYDYDYSGDFDGYNVYGGAKKSGIITFDKVPVKDMSGDIKIIIANNDYDTYEDVYYEFTVTV